jgi:hypothetical protein
MTLADDKLRQVGEEHLQAAGIVRYGMLNTGHNEPHGRSVMIKFLDGQDHHRAAVLTPGPLPDCRHSRSSCRYRQQPHHTEIARPW